MTYNDALALITAGSMVRLTDVPGLVWDKTDPIPEQYKDRLDFIETHFDDPALDDIAAVLAQMPTQLTPISESANAAPAIPRPEPALFIPPTPKGNTMTVQIKLKNTAPVDIKGKFGNDPADVVLVTKITCSDPSSALPVKGDKPEIIGLKPAKGLTLTVDGVVKGKGGEAIKCTATSNPFDVVDEAVEMVPELDANGQPVPDTNPDGTPVIDPATGAQALKLVPASAALVVAVTG